MNTLMTHKPEAASDRGKTVDEVRADLRRQEGLLERALAGIRQSLVALDEYSGVLTMPRGARPIRYIVSYLGKVGHAVERKQLVQAMFDEGAAQGRRDGLVQIERSITANATVIKEKLRPIRIVKRGECELVGLKEWGDERFRKN